MPVDLWSTAQGRALAVLVGVRGLSPLPPNQLKRAGLVDVVLDKRLERPRPTHNINGREFVMYEPHRTFEHPRDFSLKNPTKGLYR